MSCINGRGNPLLGDEALHRQVRGEQVRRIYGNTLFTTAVATLMACGLAWAVDQQVEVAGVWAWLALKVAVVLPRPLLVWFARRGSAAADPADLGLYPTYLVLLLADGLVWGLGGVWLIPDPQRLDNAAMVGAALMGLGAGSAFVLQADWRAAVVFLVPAFVPAIFHLASRGDAIGLFAAGGFAGFLLVLLTETRRAERLLVELLGLRWSTERIARERAEALAEARQHSAVKSQFLATMSHEMRTPLHGILGLTRLVRQAEQDTESRRRLELVERSGEHLLTVINDILDFSRIEAGHLKIENQPFDLPTAVDDVVALMEVQAQDKGLQMRSSVDLPRPCRVDGDAARFRQVLWNLLGNAVKFTEHGRVDLRVQREPGHLVRVWVQDTGIGIRPEDLASIFEPFRQADGSFGRRYTGAGLGLAISREICRAMGGDITCTSEVGQGSTFIFSIRLPELPEAQDAPALAPSPASLGPARVLLAEDNPVNALVAEANLQRLGLEVETVTDGEAAVARMRAGPRPDLVLMDCQMPRMDGFEATRRIRADEAAAGLPPVPIVALTANALEGDRERCLQAGMDEHLAKPFSQEALAAVLRRHLGRRHPVGLTGAPPPLGSAGGPRPG